MSVTHLAIANAVASALEFISVSQQVWTNKVKEGVQLQATHVDSFCMCQAEMQLVLAWRLT